MAARELPVIQKVHDLVLWYVPILNRFPVTHRRGIGERLVEGLYGLLEGLIRCRYAKDKLDRLEALNAELNVLRHQTRLCLELGLFQAPRYEFAAKALAEIGAELGNWTKYVKERMAAPGVPA